MPVESIPMPRSAHTARQLSPIKPPDRCPSCNSTKVRPKGTRAKKLETVRRFLCRTCRRTFTPGPRAMRSKTYPLNEILEALTLYNRGLSLEDTARRLSSRHGHSVSPATISRWLAAHPGLTTYRRLRARCLKLFKPPQIIRATKLRAGELMQDERLGKTFDFRRHLGVVYTDILTPYNAPDWMRDRAQLWNAVEKAEKRKDSQLARSLDIALPHELSLDLNIELLRGFVQEQWVDKGMIADIAIHLPGRTGDIRNVHAHIALTTREITGSGFGRKSATGTARKNSWTGGRHGPTTQSNSRTRGLRGTHRPPEPSRIRASTASRRPMSVPPARRWTSAALPPTASSRTGTSRRRTTIWLSSRTNSPTPKSAWPN